MHILYQDEDDEYKEDVDQWYLEKDDLKAGARFLKEERVANDIILGVLTIHEVSREFALISFEGEKPYWFSIMSMTDEQQVDRYIVLDRLKPKRKK